MPQTLLTRRRFLGSLGLCTALATCPSLLRPAWSATPDLKPARKRKPNVIFILSDDVGLDDISCYGGGYQTPNIDALAAGGTRFEFCYAAPLCGPSRAMLMTGRYAFRTGMTTNKTGLVMKPAQEVMLPTIVKAAGYKTVHVGKWNQLPLEPTDWGFDQQFRFYGSGVYRHHNGPIGAQEDAQQEGAQEDTVALPVQAGGRKGKKAGVGKKAKNGNPGAAQKNLLNVDGATKPIPEGAYVPDLMHDYLVDFITRNKDTPFCAYYPMSHMHGKLVPTPDSKPGTTGLKQIYADNIAYMDKLVGKLVTALDRLGLREDTLIIFTGDNGTATGPAASGTLNDETINGAKGSMKEGGSRVPLIVNWKGTTPAGKVNHDLTDFSDIMPTIAATCGAPVPANVTIDGHSFLPQIKGQKGAPREWVYVQLNQQYYVRDAKYKLNNIGELYDMKNAPHEELLVPTTDASPGITAERQHLQRVMDTLRAGTVTPTLAGGDAGARAKQNQKRTPAQRKARRQQRRKAAANAA